VCQAPVGGGDPKCFCSLDSSAGCDADKNLFCEATANGNNGCYAPLYIAGKVFDMNTGGPIEGARVVARNANNEAQSGVAVTNAAGEYNLRVTAIRNEDGTPATTNPAITLRADASGYQTFPTPPRIALAVEITTAAGDPLPVKTTTTDIGLFPLSVSGSARRGDGGRRAARHVGRGRRHREYRRWRDGRGGLGGTYAVFNVPAATTPSRATIAAARLRTAKSRRAESRTKGTARWTRRPPPSAARSRS
jgi:hypothetical protein